MDAFSTLTAVALPLDRDNIDTDIIIPSREMKSVGKVGLADGLFAGWRYTAVGGRDPDPDFLLNRPPYDGARILIAGANVGCGSSREHAVWALHEYGFRVVVAPSFNPIFRGNCIRNGIVPVQIDAAVVHRLADVVLADPIGHRITVDLDMMTLTVCDIGCVDFAIEEDSRAMLRNGWDAIDLTLQHRDRIATWRAADRAERPWIYLESAL